MNAPVLSRLSCVRGGGCEPVRYKTVTLMGAIKRLPATVGRDTVRFIAHRPLQTEPSRLLRYERLHIKITSCKITDL